MDEYDDRLQRIGPLHSVAEWAVPERVEVDDGQLRWHRGSPGSVHLAGPLGGLLTEFLRLADAPDERIEAFARKRGPLRLCRQHGKPSTHYLRRQNMFDQTPAPTPTGDLPAVPDDAEHDPGSGPAPEPGPGPADPICLPAGGIDSWTEPLERWRAYAREFGAVASIASELDRGQPGKVADWKTLTEALDDPHLTSAKGAPGPQKRALAAYIQERMNESDIRLRFLWPDKPLIEINTPDLFSTLTLQLALAAGRADGFAYCAWNQHFFTPETRQPPRGQRACCGAMECIRERQRAQTRASRDKKAQAKQPRKKTPAGKPRAEKVKPYP